MKPKEPDFMTSAYWTQPFKNKWGNSDCRILYVSARETYGASDSSKVTFDMHVDSTGNVVVFPNGKLTVNNSGARDPDWRERNEKHFGVLIRPAKDLAGQLYCPHTGHKIPVSRIEDNPVLWVALEHKVALKAGGIRYDSPDGAPYHVSPESKYVSHQIKYSFDNPKRFKAFAKRWENLYAEAKLRLSVMVVEPRGYPNMSSMWDVFLREDVTTVEEALVVATGRLNCNASDVDNMWCMCRCIHDFDMKYAHNLAITKLQCADHYQSDQLTFAG